MNVKNKDTKNVLLEVDILNSAFFVGNVDLSNKLDIASKVNNYLKNLFDGDPTILPIPNDAPFELPRIILNSKNKLFSCNISPQRVDFIVNKSRMAAASDKAIDIEVEFMKHTISIAQIILEKLGWSINRVALISQFKSKPEGGVIPFLQKMLTDDFNKAAKELQLHSLKLVEINDFKVNHWLRLISQNGGTDKEFLLISSDLNTLQTEKHDIDEDNAKIFFEAALDVTKSTISKILS